MATISLVPGAAKGWVLYDQTGTPAVLDSHNVASVTDDSTGLFTINWDQDFANANYCAVAMVNDEGANQTFANESGTGTDHLAGSLKVVTVNLTTIVDRSRVSVAAFGDV